MSRRVRLLHTPPPMAWHHSSSLTEKADDPRSAAAPAGLFIADLTVFEAISGDATRMLVQLHDAPSSERSRLRDLTHGYTCVHLACVLASSDVLSFLLDRFQLATMVTDYSGSYPIHLAAERGHLEHCRMLIKAHPGCVTTLDGAMRTPRERALHSGRVAIAEMFSALGGGDVEAEEARRLFLDTCKLMNLHTPSNESWKDVEGLVQLTASVPLTALPWTEIPAFHRFTASSVMLMDVRERSALAAPLTHDDDAAGGGGLLGNWVDDRSDGGKALDGGASSLNPASSMWRISSLRGTIPMFAVVPGTVRLAAGMLVCPGDHAFQLNGICFRTAADILSPHGTGTRLLMCEASVGAPFCVDLFFPKRNQFTILRCYTGATRDHSSSQLEGAQFSLRDPAPYEMPFLDSCSREARSVILGTGEDRLTEASRAIRRNYRRWRESRKFFHIMTRIMHKAAIVKRFLRRTNSTMKLAIGVLRCQLVMFERFAVHELNLLSGLFPVIARVIRTSLAQKDQVASLAVHLRRKEAFAIMFDTATDASTSGALGHSAKGTNVRATFVTGGSDMLSASTDLTPAATTTLGAPMEGVH